MIKAKYSKINKSVIANVGLGSFPETQALYKYLLDNNTAYYFAKFRDNNPTDLQKRILEVGSKFNDRYDATLGLIREICLEEQIDFALFKTHKYIPEVVDGDLDLVVRERDFELLLNKMASRGFICLKEAKFKAVCTKEGYTKVEPRAEISFHGHMIFDERQIWQNITLVDTGVGSVKSTTLEFDTVCLLLNVLYGPKYTSLYLYLMFKGCDFMDIVNICEHRSDGYGIEDLRVLLDKLQDDEKRVFEKKFPLLLGFVEYLRWFFKFLWTRQEIPVSKKIRHVVFFFYSSLEYLLFGKLHFSHKWL